MSGGSQPRRRRRIVLTVIWVEFVAGTLVWSLLALVHPRFQINLVVGMFGATVSTLAALVTALKVNGAPNAASGSAGRGKERSEVSDPQG